MNNINMSKFPHSEIRPLQENILKIIDQNWDNYKYFICEIPTGVGKSAIAKTICSSTDKAFIITSTKQLQDQYVNDFKDGTVVSIKGKANYKCSLNEGLTCENGYCIIDKNQIKECKKNGTCPYFKTRDRAMVANIALTSYQYFLRAVDCAGVWKPRNVIVFDECHLLEQQLVQFAEIKLSVKELIEKYDIIKDCDLQSFTQISIPPDKSGFQENEKWLKTIMSLIFERRNEKFQDIKNILGLKNKDPDSLSLEELDIISGNNKEYYQLDKIFKKLELFIKSNKQEDWIIDPWEDGLQMTPVAVNGLFNNYVNNMCTDKIIFMSATILDLPGLRKTLGLPKDETFLIRADSEFDPKKSPIIYKPICKMNYKEINENLNKITSEIEKILKQHPDEKGIIHTGNYKIAKHLIQTVKSNRLIMKTGNNDSNEQLLKRHTDTDDPTVLVSPSLTTGTDLKDDLSRFQIIVKLPWISLNDKRVKEKIKRDDNWYAVEMFKTLIQSTGRSTRSKEDWSITYVLDNSFKWWINKHKQKGWFQPQFLKRIKW